ncbi:hypothetical protein [Marinigracilibium pacificum]|uniref:Bulb-type lectin domain-containing protein n=1 Tax=Marinigracilibium pacificum TaxID=2729599 RepID=A0A848J536_9BACT|nr:hypothetical protein [Marinigracilibium pacificum]NMM50826.1 hypothetical protein [Marinigracilibium pacificum]
MNRYNITRILFILLVLAPNDILADEPPCWCEFSIYSFDSLYRADIIMANHDTSVAAWENDWIINVFDTSIDSIIWSSKFYNDGYGAGILSNDGKIYVYGNSWLIMDYKNQLVIYTADTIFQYSGRDLGLIESDYPNTVSHKIWIEDYYLYPNYQTDSTRVIIATLDSKKIELNIYSGEIRISKIKQSKEMIEQLVNVKRFGLWTIIIIGLGIILITIRNFKNKRA